MDAANSTGVFTSILASHKIGNVNVPPQLDVVLDTIANASVWTILATLIFVCVVYDQGA